MATKTVVRPEADSQKKETFQIAGSGENRYARRGAHDGVRPIRETENERVIEFGKRVDEATARHAKP
jgi:hypothetical protein